jgi:hypothetical protein
MTTSIKDAIKRKPGRPPLEIDWALAEKLAQIGCTDEEIASIVGVSHETFVRRKRDPVTAERLGRARSMCKASLRRIQWKLAEAGNATMGVWVGKQLLGQRDKFDDVGAETNQPLPWKD